MNILLYADDIVLITKDEFDMQELLSIVDIWCERWRLGVNLSKTNILYVRKKKKSRSKFMFLFNKRQVPYCSDYKYLGCSFNEYLDYNFTIDTLVSSAGRALSCIVSKMIKNGGFPYNVYSTLFNACVCSVSQYGCKVFGYKQPDSALQLHQRAARAFLGLPAV